MSKAERLANRLDYIVQEDGDPAGYGLAEIAAELRRLSVEVERLTTLWTECAAAAATETRETARLSAEIEALRKALECLLIGAYAVGVPQAAERAVLHEAVDIAEAALAARPGLTKE